MNTLLLALLFTSSLCVASGATNSTTKTLRLRGRTLQLATASSSEITGPFDIVTTAKFNDLRNGWYQRVFDFGNGDGNDNVWLGQVANTNDMAFEVCIDGKFTRCTAPGALVQGELATWKVGVDQNGFQWLEKNGNRVCSMQGQVPKNVFRANKLLGQSNWRADSAMKGAVIGIDITNAGEDRDDGLLNKPEQIRGPFEISVQARFDDPQGGHWQRVFDFGNGPGKDNILFGQYANTNDMSFFLFQNNQVYELTARGAIVTGQLDSWKVGIDVKGLMWIEKAGKLIAEKQAVVPANITRKNLLLGASNWPENAPLDGVVLALRVSPMTIARPPIPTPTQAPVVPPPPGPKALFAITVNNYVDPILQGLTIPSNAAQVGMWSSVINWPIVPVHAAVLVDGRVITYGSPTGAGVQGGRTFAFWNPKLGTGSTSITTSPNAQAVDSFCSTGQTLSNGQFLLSGGGSYTSGASGKETARFDPITSSVSRSDNLNYQRWYSSQTTLPDGKLVITGGGSPYLTGTYPGQTRTNGVVSNIPEIYTDGIGWTPLMGAKSDDAFGFAMSHYWYPRQWVTPTGTVFGISTEKMWEMQVNGTGSIRTIGDFKTAPSLTDNTIFPNTGPTSTGVMYDIGKIIQFGGNGYYNGYPSRSSKAATMFDITKLGRTGKVSIRETNPMTNGRQWANTNILPDGNVLVTGGSNFNDNGGSNAVLAAETWDPTTGNWTVRASASIYRGYHSTAVLLPNGAVFTGGGGMPGPVTNFNAEIYYPPYLFTTAQNNNNTSILSKRPTIISLNKNRGIYGEKIRIQLGVNDTVSAVSFMTLPSATHSFDSNMRRMKLNYQMGTTNNTITVTLPSSSNLAPPGYYYLNVVNSAGVPSHAVIIGMNSVAPPPIK